MKPIDVILAATPLGEIGYQNTIPWRLKGDLKRFRELTMGNIVIMGKNTYTSLPKALEGRIVIVVSKSLVESKTNPKPFEAYFTIDLEEAIQLANRLDGERICIAGGVQIYEEALKLPCKLYLTQVYKTAPNGYDAQIKDMDLSKFDMVGEPHYVYELNPVTKVLDTSHVYVTYQSTDLPPWNT